jgi:DNA-binding NtrC family response regulator
MTLAGYRVLLAKNTREVIKWTFHHDLLDLIVLDPDLPDSEDTRLLDDILDRIPALPVIVHTYRSEYGSNSLNMKSVVFVEKCGSSVEHLKRVVDETLAEHSPLLK